MCNECNQNPCANTCPNNPFFEERTETCPLCGEEYPEEEMIYAVCEKCMNACESFYVALDYGKDNQYPVNINGLFAKMLTSEQINEALLALCIEMQKQYYGVAMTAAHDLLTDDPDAFSHWLLEKKNID